MTTISYTAYAPAVVWADQVAGVGGTQFVASNMNGMRSDLVSWIVDHINGVSNPHNTTDIETTTLLTESLAYSNAAGTYTVQQRDDMLATLFSDVFGGTGTLTARRATWGAAGGGDLTTLRGLLNGGSPALGAFTATGIISTAIGATPAGRFRNATGNPHQAILAVQNFSGGATILSVDDVSATVTGTLSVSGATTLAAVTGTTGHLTGALTLDNTVTFSPVVINESTTHSAAGTVLAYYDNVTTHQLRVSQNGGAWTNWAGSAAAIGAAGFVQYSGGGGAFSSDDGLRFDGTNNWLGINLPTASAPATTLDMLGAATIRGIAADPGNAGTGNARLYVDSATGKLYAHEGTGSAVALIGGAIGVSAASTLATIGAASTALGGGGAISGGTNVLDILANIATSGPFNGVTWSTTAYTGNEGPNAIKTGATDAPLSQLLAGHFGSTLRGGPHNVLSIGTTTVAAVLPSGATYSSLDIKGKWRTNTTSTGAISIGTAPGSDSLYFVYADSSITSQGTGNEWGLAISGAQALNATPSASGTQVLLATLLYDKVANTLSTFVDYSAIGTVSATQVRKQVIATDSGTINQGVTSTTGTVLNNTSTAINVATPGGIQYEIGGDILVSGVAGATGINVWICGSAEGASTAVPGTRVSRYGAIITTGALGAQTVIQIPPTFVPATPGRYTWAIAVSSSTGSSVTVATAYLYAKPAAL